jgi:hypothetical protein
MRKILCGMLLSTALLTAACTSTGAIDPNAVIADTKAICSFTPLAADVASLLSSNPKVTTAEAVAALICGALPAATVGAKPKVAHSVVVVVNGVPIHGTVD